MSAFQAENTGSIPVTRSLFFCNDFLRLLGKEHHDTFYPELSSLSDDKIMPLQKQLERLHIPEREAKVYLELLKLGLTMVGPIVNKTKMHRMMVYQSLERLKDMRLASLLMKNGRQHWQATNPSIILDQVKKQELLAVDVVKQLELLRTSKADEVNVQILYGKQGLIENLESLLLSAGRTDKVMRIIGGASDRDFYELLGDWHKRYVAMQKEQGVRKIALTPSGYSSRFNEHNDPKLKNELGEIKEGLSSPTFTRMTREAVSIEVYGSSEPVIIQIRNTDIANAYIEKFDLLYKAAKKIG